MLTPLNNSEIFKSRRPEPFVGYGGVGSRIRITDHAGVIRIQQSLASQLGVLAMTGLIGPGLTVLSYVQWDHFQKHPKFILVALSFGVLVGWWAFLKYFLRWAGGQRLEFRKSDRTLVLHSWKGQAVRILKPEEIQQVSVHESFYRTKGNLVSNYTLTLKEANGDNLDLVTSDKPEVILRINELLGNQGSPKA